MSDTGIYLSPSTKISKSNIHPRQCRICSAPAEYLFFGVISCASCKMFFRRNAPIGQEKFFCNNNGQCVINPTTRHLCTSCRLAKCLKCGMSTDLFRAPRNNKLIKFKRLDHPKHFSPLNLLQSDKSLLTNEQWTLLSNLFNSYKESQLISIGQRLRNMSNIEKFKNIDYQTVIKEFLTCTYETTGIYLRLNDDLCKLPLNDRSIMLYNAADNLSCMSCAFVMHLCDLFQLDPFLNSIITMYGKRTIDIHRWGMKFIDPDIVIVKLAFSLYAVTTNTYLYTSNSGSSLINSLHIFKIQNKYAELTWKYLLYRYDYHQAIKRYVNLITWLEALTIFTFHAQSLTLHVNDINSLVEQTELTLILDDVDELI